MDHRGAGSEGGVDGEHRIELLVIDGDECRRGPGGGERFGGDRGHPIADRSAPWCRTSGCRRDSARVSLAGGGVAHRGGVLVGEHAHDPGYPSVAEVSILRMRMGQRAGEQGDVQGAGDVGVPGKDQLAGDQRPAVHFALADSDHGELGAVLSHGGPSRMRAAAVRIAATGFT